MCLTCVNPPVFGQVTGNGEGLATVLADIRPFARMSPHVFLQVSSRRPAFTAHRAHVRALPGVPPHVHVEAGERGEVFGAVGAAVGPLPGVCPQVALQPVAGLEAFAALRTQEAALGAVAGPVRVEAGQRAVRLAALVALVHAESVCALVDTKLSHSWRAETNTSQLKTAICSGAFNWITLFSSAESCSGSAPPVTTIALKCR